jgi:hypothetical protein
MVEVYESDAAAARREARRERAKASAPERFAKPRMMLLVAVFALVAFGLLMIYSSSSIVALTSETYITIRPTLLFISSSMWQSVVLRQQFFRLVIIIFGLALFCRSCGSKVVTSRYGLVQLLRSDAYGRRVGSLLVVHLPFSHRSLQGYDCPFGSLYLPRVLEDMALDLRSLLLRAAALIIVPLGLILVRLTRNDDDLAVTIV